MDYNDKELYSTIRSCLREFNLENDKTNYGETPVKGTYPRCFNQLHIALKRKYRTADVSSKMIELNKAASPEDR